VVESQEGTKSQPSAPYKTPALPLHATQLSTRSSRIPHGAPGRNSYVTLRPVTRTSPSTQKTLGRRARSETMPRFQRRPLVTTCHRETRAAFPVVHVTLSHTVIEEHQAMRYFIHCFSAADDIEIARPRSVQQRRRYARIAHAAASYAGKCTFARSTECRSKSIQLLLEILLHVSLFLFSRYLPPFSAQAFTSIE